MCEPRAPEMPDEMTDAEKSKEKLLQEIKELRQRLAACEVVPPRAASQNQPLRQRAAAQFSAPLIEPPVPSFKDTRELRDELQIYQIELEMQNEELRRAQMELAESRDRYIDLYDFSPVGYLTLNERGLIQEANLTAARQLGVGKGKLINYPLYTLMDQADGDKFHLHLRKIFQTKKRQVCQLSLGRQDGSEFKARLDSVFYQDSAGNSCCRSSMIDVSAEFRLGKALEESEVRYRTLVETSLEGICIVDAAGKFTYVNQRLAAMLGYNPQEMLGRPAVDFCMEVHREFLQQKLELHRQGTAEVYELSVQRQDGTTIWVMVSATPLMSAANQYDSAFGMITDITERKELEKELSEYHWNLEELVSKRTAELSSTNQRLQEEIKQRRLLFSAVEHLVEGVIITDIQGIVQYVNPSFERIRGYGRAEIIGQPIQILISGQDKKALVQEIVATFHKGKSYIGRIKGRRKDGILLDLEMNISSIQNQDGAMTNFVAIEHDVTQQVELEGQLRQAQKMEAIGTLAGGIAHDFNNILSPIITHTEIALEDLPITSSVRTNLERVLRAGFRAAALVKQILAISRRQEYERQATQLDFLVKESVKFIRASLPATIDIQLRIGKDVGLVEVDPSQIHQVLLNLFTNAAQAMSDRGGMLQVSLDRLEVAGVLSDHGQSIPAGSYVQITVSDTGPGMTPATLERIFEPYFTTKPPGKGTGLGLAVALGIIRDHGGFIDVDSQVGGGTTFRIYLPRTEHRSVPPVNEVTSMPSGRESILLVDDEEEIVGALIFMLERLGYQVTAFTSSNAALDRFREQPEQYDLLITDQTMPGMTGEDLAREILSIRINLPIILCTGFSEIIDETKVRGLGIKEFLMKPLTKGKLAVAIRQALADRQEQEI